MARYQVCPTCEDTMRVLRHQRVGVSLEPEETIFHYTLTLECGHQVRVATAQPHTHPADQEALRQEWESQ